MKKIGECIIYKEFREIAVVTLFGSQARSSCQRRHKKENDLPALIACYNEQFIVYCMIQCFLEQCFLEQCSFIRPKKATRKCSELQRR